MGTSTSRLCLIYCKYTHDKDKHSASELPPFLGKANSYVHGYATESCLRAQVSIERVYLIMNSEGCLELLCDVTLVDLMLFY